MYLYFIIIQYSTWRAILYVELDVDCCFIKRNIVFTLNQRMETNRHTLFCLIQVRTNQQKELNFEHRSWLAILNGLLFILFFVRIDIAVFINQGEIAIQCVEIIHSAMRL